jgi:hypothetical protein
VLDEALAPSPSYESAESIIVPALVGLINTYENTTLRRLLIVLMLVLLACSRAETDTPAVRKVAVRDRLEPLSPGALTIGGHIGQKLGQCITNRILVQEVNPMLELFLTVGNGWSQTNSYRVWAPQPMFMGNCPASGSTAEGYKINLGHTPESLQGSSRVAPPGNAACEAGARWQEVPGAQDKEGSGILTSASKSEGYGTRVGALPELLPGQDCGRCTTSVTGNATDFALSLTGSYDGLMPLGATDLTLTLNITRLAAGRAVSKPAPVNGQEMRQFRSRDNGQT